MGYTVLGSNPGGVSIFSAPIQTGPGAHPASYTKATGFFSGVSRLGIGVDLLTPWSRVLLEKLTSDFAASQEIPRIYGTRKTLTVPTSARVDYPSHLTSRLKEE
jgi:hypothetical protein